MQPSFLPTYCNLSMPKPTCTLQLHINITVGYGVFSWNINALEFHPHCKPIPCNENRVFPVKFSHREIPVMKTGVPAMRTGVPCNENRFFPVWKTSQGKPCSGPVLALYRIAVWVLSCWHSTPMCVIEFVQSSNMSVSKCRYLHYSLFHTYEFRISIKTTK